MGLLKSAYWIKVNEWRITRKQEILYKSHLWKVDNTVYTFVMILLYEQAYVFSYTIKLVIAYDGSVSSLQLIHFFSPEERDLLINKMDMAVRSKLLSDISLSENWNRLCSIYTNIMFVE